LNIFYVYVGEVFGLLNQTKLAVSKMAAEKVKYFCLGCKEALKRKDTSVMCQVCEEYTHPSCSNISNDLLKYLIDESSEGNSISWTCTHCKKVAKVLNNKVKALNKDIMDIKKSVNSLQTGQDDLKKEMNACKEKCSMFENKISDTSKTVKNDVFSELRDREEKKCNVLIYGVPEPVDLQSGKEKKEHDIEWAADIAYAINVTVVGNDIKFIKRLGDVDKSEDPRPILLGFKDVEKKKELIINSRGLKDNVDYEEIYIAPDLTKQQRDEEIELGKEAMRRNAELDENAALNSEWKVVGMRGEKRLILRRIWPDATRRGGARGRGTFNERGRGRSTARGRITARGRSSETGPSRGRGRGGQKRQRTPETGKEKKRTRPSEVEEEGEKEPVEREMPEEEENTMEV